MATERIEKFSNDLEEIQLRKDKYQKEVLKLSKWMFKHQDENIPSTAKSRLIELMGKTKATLCSNEEEISVVITLLEMYCALPEGKLTTSKGKQKAVKWLEEFGRKTTVSTAGIDEALANEVLKIYIVMDLEESYALLESEIDVNGEPEILENVPVQKEILEELTTKFNKAFEDETCGQVRVFIQDGIIAKII